MRNFVLKGFVICLILILSFSMVFGQSPPPDLEIIGTAGGAAPWTVNLSVQIEADGQGSFTRFVSGDIGSSALSSGDFTLTSGQMEQIWQVIDENDFFNLIASKKDEEILDRTFAHLLVVANGDTHHVFTRNIAYEPFDNIIEAINNATPDTLDLIYDISPPPEIDFVDPFGFGFTKPDPSQIPDHYPEKLKNTLGKSNQASYFNANDCSNWANHGTTVGYEMPLQEAVNKGIAKLKSKGEIYGDGVSIEIDNTGNHTGDEIDVTVDMEFWGTNATPANVQKIKNAIENKWNGHTTSGGKDVTVTARTRTNSSATSPPGRPGYHQVELGNPPVSYVAGMGSSFDVNRCAGSGDWETSGTDLDETYAHEAGHLMGLDDHYQGYNKQADGSWNRESDNANMTADQVAQKIKDAGSSMSVADIKNWMNQPGNQRVTHPDAGHGNDMMATLGGNVQQSHIDQVTADAGIIIIVEPGTIIVNKDDSEQNYVITRRRRIYVPPGGTKKLEGLFISCIDASDGVPSVGAHYDLIPHLSNWSTIESAQVLLTLVNYIDEQELFGFMDTDAIFAIWAITNLSSFGDDDTEQLLMDAGIDYNNIPMDFPRLSSPSPGDTNTSYLIPGELFVVDVTPGRSLVDVGETVNISGTPSTPSVSGLVVIQTGYVWNVIDKPSGSSADITNPTSSSISFTPDTRGIYTLELTVEMQIEIQPTPGSGIQEAIEQDITTSSTVRVVAKDEFTETFENGSLAASPFPWSTSGEASWTVTDALPHTGNYSAKSGDIDSSQTTILEIDVSVPESGTLAFMYKIVPNLYYCNFLVDGVIYGLLFDTEDTGEWNVAQYALGQGEHTLTWDFTLDFLWSDSDHPSIYIDDIFFPDASVFTDVSEENDFQQTGPREYKLYQNNPNPFNPVTTISYDIPKPDRVQVHIYDLKGRLVNVLVDMNEKAGSHQVMWNGQDMSGQIVSSGIYFIRIVAGDFTDSKKIMFLK